MTLTHPQHLLFYTEASAPGGVTGIIDLLARGLQSTYRITVLHPDNPGMRAWSEGLRNEGLTTSAVALRNRGGLTGWLDLCGLWHLAHILKTADIIHAHLHTPFSCLPVLVMARVVLRKRVVATEHYISQLRYLRHRPLPWFLSWIRELRIAFLMAVKTKVVRIVNSSVTVSETNRTLMLSLFGNFLAPRVCTILNGVSLPALQPAPPRQHPFPVLCVVAGLNNQKGHRHLIDALPVIRKVYPDVRVLFVGTGHLRSELERHALVRGVSRNILFLGHREDVPAILRGADLSILPSLFEGMPLSLLEAMAIGIPVVATAVDGSTEVVVDGETGLLVPPGDSTRLAEAVLRMLADNQERARMANAARRRVHDVYSVERMIHAHCLLYDRMMGETPEE
jgi:glycosyltransferase involved in cell wall biosynthesis